MSSAAIQVRGLGKRYVIGSARAGSETFRESIGNAIRRQLRRALAWEKETGPGAGEAAIWALKDISFDVDRGEVVGIIGHNGSGKSTLLKVLSRITEPTEGYAEIDGRLGALLEVGTGFHSELTGRENIFLSGAILGMAKSDIVRKFDEIVSFSEVEPFLDTAVKHYSSGMYMRLAFAVAAHLDPDIMLVDEVLAVGDAAFQKKCLGKMNDVAKGGRTVLLVSHNMGAINTLCQRVIRLDAGRLHTIGQPDHVVSKYISDLFHYDVQDLRRLRLPGFGAQVWFSQVQLISADAKTVKFGQGIQYSLVIRSNINAKNVSIGSSIFSSVGGCVGNSFSNDFALQADEEVVIALVIGNPNLAPGVYYAGFSIGYGGKHSLRHDLDIVIGQPVFEVLPISDEDCHIMSWAPTWGHIVFRDVTLEVQRRSIVALTDSRSSNAQ